MSRWLLVAGGLLVLVGACKAKSYTPANGDDGDAGDDASGDDDGGSCTCQVSSAASSVDIPCGSSACVGTTDYDCTPEGVALLGSSDLCGGSDASFTEEGDCVTSCASMCGVPNGCGGICECATGIPCNPNGTCGNGCSLGVGEVCLPSSDTDAGTATTCCSSGYLCFAHDSGVTTCCAEVGAGTCTQDTDCCDYPAATCSPTAHTCG